MVGEVLLATLVNMRQYNIHRNANKCPQNIDGLEKVNGINWSLEQLSWFNALTPILSSSVPLDQTVETKWDSKGP